VNLCHLSHIVLLLLAPCCWLLLWKKKEKEPGKYKMLKLVGFLLVTLVVCAAAHEGPEPPHQHASQQTEYATLARGFGDHLE